MSYGLYSITVPFVPRPPPCLPMITTTRSPGSNRGNSAVSLLPLVRTTTQTSVHPDLMSTHGWLRSACGESPTIAAARTGLAVVPRNMSDARGGLGPHHARRPHRLANVKGKSTVVGAPLGGKAQSFISRSRQLPTAALSPSEEALETCPVSSMVRWTFSKALCAPLPPMLTQHALVTAALCARTTVSICPSERPTPGTIATGGVTPESGAGEEGDSAPRAQPTSVTQMMNSHRIRGG